MATVLGTKAAATVQRRFHIYETIVVSTFSVPATGDGTAANDIIEMVKVPINATITDVLLASTDVDTGGSPAHVMSVGDGGDVDRFILDSTIGQAGGVARLNNQVGAGYKYTADDTVDIKVVTASATKATGTFTMVVRYAMDP
jgi:hypothetical protein